MFSHRLLAIRSYGANQTCILSETKHLGPGSECPPRRRGVLRLYSMKMCPFAQRTRLVLSAKNIPHEVVNVNLKTKPAWYLSLYEPGLVPALEQDGLFVPESLVTSELLEELHPTPALLPAEPWRRAADRFFIHSFGTVIGTLYQMYFHLDEPKKIEELHEKFQHNIQPLAAELARRGTPFFFGDRPGMLDLMVWPWVERLAAFTEVCRSRPLLPADGDRAVRALRDWALLMERDEHVSRCVTPLEDHVNYLVTHKVGIVAAQKRNALKSSVESDD
ncbi:glutathione S-transferase omega-1-like isoform X2 [Amphibalanus amphitrite]|uniref:glutathione S-transferase omega-1-like isoform X2 n=1 Tax=Amphibalanus amphitrite TaxID=1232801 RepID=UPI001C912A45|nr:glutathione S-transferase omega-1-like isoform X2 [Amphibalanus amphitrite]